MVEVVSCILVRDGRILLTQRRADKDFPLTWECPGGKVDGNESHHDAIRRELKEEIGVGVDWIPEHSVWCGRFENIVQRADRADIFLLFYRVGFTGEPRPIEGQGIGWFTEAEMRGLYLAPGNTRALDHVTLAAFPETRQR